MKCRGLGGGENLVRFRGLVFRRSFFGPGFRCGVPLLGLMMPGQAPLPFFLLFLQAGQLTDSLRTLVSSAAFRQKTSLSDI
jgi:hypothetical protein